MDRSAGSGCVVADLVVGAHDTNIGDLPAGLEGAAYYFTLDESGPTETVYIPNPTPGRLDSFGWSVAASFDPSNGTRRVHVGSPYDNVPLTNDTGLENVDIGSLFTFVVGDFASFTRINGTLSGTEFGYAVAGEVDIDGDGIDDMLIGAPGTDRPTPFDPGNPSSLSPRGCDEGAVVIYSGAVGAGGTTPHIATVRMFGFDDSAANHNHHSRFGSSIAGLRALAPGFRDQFVAGAPYYDRAFGYPYPVPDIGWAAVYALNPADGTIMVEDRLVWPDWEGDHFGFAVANVLNPIPDPGPSQFPDIAVGIPLHDISAGGDDGLVSVYRGKPADGLYTDSPPVYDIPPPDSSPVTSGAQFGYSLAAYEPVPGSGEILLLVGAPFNSTGGLTRNGSVFVFSLGATSATFVARVDGTTNEEMRCSSFECRNF